MGRDPRFDVLFEPVQIGPKRLRNRFFQVPHSTGFGTEHPHAQASFRATRAEGGWAAVCVEIASIDPESDRNPAPIPARLWDETDVAALAMVCDQAHGHGALVGVELWHSGAHVDGSPSRLAPGAPSQLPSDAFPWTYPRELTLTEIKEIHDLYSKAATRAQAAGIDIVYVYGGHGYLPMQFLSSFYNQRTDAYGGALENRARFWLEAIDAVRSATAGRCAIAVRLGLDPTSMTSVGVEEALAFVRLADDLVDLWDVNTSTISSPWLDMRPARLSESGYQFEWASRIREATAKPIVGVGRLTNPDEMVAILQTRAWDLIGAARPSIADPFLPQKIEQGRLDEIRECIGCNICIASVTTLNHIACTQNPTAGEEYRRGWHPERFAPIADTDRHILVVGAGPAGMECALVLAKRGVKHVQLVDAAKDLGGHVKRVARLPGLAEWARLIDYREKQFRKLNNLELTLGLNLTAASALDFGADTVIIATGATWAADGLNHVTHKPIPQVGNPNVVTPDLVIDDPKSYSGRVLIYDCEGYFMGVGIAELLAVNGAQVQLVTPHALVAPYLDRTFEGSPTRRRLIELGVELVPDTILEQIMRKDCILLGPKGGFTAPDIDHVVFVTARRSNDKLLRELTSDNAEVEGAGVVSVHAIGDCVAPRLIANCIFDGHRLAREIDSSNPARALPYLRG